MAENPIFVQRPDMPVGSDLAPAAPIPDPAANWFLAPIYLSDLGTPYLGQYPYQNWPPPAPYYAPGISMPNYPAFELYIDVPSAMIPPVVADTRGQGNKGFITELDIRIFLRDYPNTNKLLGDFEFTSEELRTAMTLVVDKWNDTPPFINSFTVDTFPFRWAYIMGTTANLLTMAAMKFRRNKLQYNVPGGGISDQNKDKEYDDTAVRLSKEFDAWMMRVKTEINLSQCWGSDTQYYGYDKWW